MNNNYLAERNLPKVLKVIIKKRRKRKERALVYRAGIVREIKAGKHTSIMVVASCFASRKQ